MSAERGDHAALLAAMPWVFVCIWSTGFVVARFGMPHAPPFGFLSWRFGLSVLALLLWVTLSKARWPRSRRQWAHLAVTGVFMQAGYLGGVWSAVKSGMGAGTSALIVGLQPVLVALWIAYAGREQRVSVRQWLGLGLGLLGLLLVVGQKVDLGEVTAANLGMAVVALLSITLGTLYQKRFVGPCDVRSASAVQMLAALAVCLPLAWWMESEAVRWHPQLIGAMAWSVLVLTLGGSSLLYLLIQRGAATRVASLMYLVPAGAALLAWMLFGEALGGAVGVGLVVTAVGVALIMRGPVAKP